MSHHPIQLPKELNLETFNQAQRIVIDWEDSGELAGELVLALLEFFRPLINPVVESNSGIEFDATTKGVS